MKRGACGPTRRIPEDLLSYHPRGARDITVDKQESWTLRARIAKDGMRVLWNLRSSGIGNGAWTEDSRTLHLGSDMLPVLLAPFQELLYGARKFVVPEAPFNNPPLRFVEVDLEILAEAALLLRGLARRSDNVRRRLRAPIEVMDPTPRMVPGVDLLAMVAEYPHPLPAWRGERDGAKYMRMLTEHWEVCTTILRDVVSAVKIEDARAHCRRMGWLRHMVCK